jgi:hypothetical protein
MTATGPPAPKDARRGPAGLAERVPLLEWQLLFDHRHRKVGGAGQPRPAHRVSGRGSNRTTGSDSRTTRRMSAGPPNSPAARAWTSTFPTAVASTGPARTGRPVASRLARSSGSCGV